MRDRHLVVVVVPGLPWIALFREVPSTASRSAGRAEPVVDLGHRLVLPVDPRASARHVGRDDEEDRKDRDADQQQDEDAVSTRRMRNAIMVAGSRHLLRSRSARGSEASRTPSPNRLKASVVMSSAAPGKMMNHHAVV